MKNAKESESKQLFEDLMAYQHQVFCICLGFSRNWWDAEELTQDVYLKALKNITKLKDFRTARVWLLRICRNTCLDYVKKMRIKLMLGLKAEDLSAELQTPETHVVFSQQIKQVKNSIQRLPNKLREVFVLKEYGELSYKEIAGTLNIKEGTVMSRLNRARQAIKDSIREEIE